MNTLLPSSSPLPSSLQFKDQVVREAVEKICREFSGQCCIHKPLGGGAGGGEGRGEVAGGVEAQQVPEVSSSTLPGAPSSSTPPCSSCRGQTTGGGYQCRYVLANCQSLWMSKLVTALIQYNKSHVLLTSLLLSGSLL